MKDPIIIVDFHDFRCDFQNLYTKKNTSGLKDAEGDPPQPGRLCEPAPYSDRPRLLALGASKWTDGSITIADSH